MRLAPCLNCFDGTERVSWWTDWFFIGAYFINGLFSGIRGVISAYLQDIHDPAEFRARVQPLMINCFLFGAMGGSIVGMVWVAVVNAIPGAENSTIALFGPCLVGILLSTSMAIAVHKYCPEPAQKTLAPAGGASGSTQATPPISRTAKTVMAIILVAGSLDTFGDYGTRFARNTILSNRYPAGRAPVINYVLMASNIISVYVAQQIVLRTAKAMGFMRANGAWVLLGNLASCVVQFALLAIVWFDQAKTAMAGFVCVWMLSQIFGICSTFAALFLWPAFVPAHRRGELNGLRGSLTALVNCIAPVILAFIYQTGSMDPIYQTLNGTDFDFPEGELAPTDRASVICLSVCGGVSFLALLGYTPLPRLLPKPPPPKAPKPPPPPEPKDAADPSARPSIVLPHPLEYYSTVGYLEWCALPMSLRMEINKERVAKGLPRVVFPWGSWRTDLEIAAEIHHKAHEELSEFRDEVTRWLTDDEYLARAVARRKERLQKAQEPAEKARVDAQCREMGQWIADYFDDAGYDVWVDAGYLFKSMLMNAFPPLDALDAKKANLESPDEMRTLTLNFLRVLDLHISTAQVTSHTDLSDHHSVAAQLPAR